MENETDNEISNTEPDKSPYEFLFATTKIQHYKISRGPRQDNGAFSLRVYDEDFEVDPILWTITPGSSSSKGRALVHAEQDKYYPLFFDVQVLVGPEDRFYLHYECMRYFNKGVGDPVKIECVLSMTPTQQDAFEKANTYCSTDQANNS